MTHPPFHRRRADGVELFVRLTPKSSRDAVEGIETAADGRSHLKARVRAVPEDGKANAALIAWAAAALGVPRAQVELLHGASGRQKVLELRFDDAAALAAAQARVACWMAGGADA